MEKTVKESRWDVYTMPAGEFLEKLGLPEGTRIINVSVTGGREVVIHASHEAGEPG